MITAAAVVVCALDLLGRSTGSTVPIRFLDVPPANASANVEAFVIRNPDTMYLVTSTAAFRDAMRGPGEPGHLDGCRKIASVIVHEEWHLRYGDDEEGAYIAQITALMRLNAATIMLTGVRQSMAAALAARQAHAKRQLVVALR
jgi:hypothetical protein